MLFNLAYSFPFSGQTKSICLHSAVEGFDPVDWNGRMRIIMGVAYCIQHMHEMSPPIAHPDLKSSAILLSEDGAAKVHMCL
jgi:serine/threonine protein kinase